jgi:hypothetical protein
MGAARLEPRGGQKEQSDRKGQGQTLSNIEWSGAASVFFQYGIKQHDTILMI